MPEPVYPTYTVDGVPMDRAEWYLTPATRQRALPAKRGVSVEVPGRSGQLPVTGLDEDASTVTLGLFVTAARPDGTEGDLPEMNANLDALLGMFGTEHRLLDVRYFPGPGVERQADAMVLAGSEPDIDVPIRRARVQLVLTLPGVYWRDPITRTWSAPLTGTRGVTTLAGSTAPITDAVVRVKGPATSPSVTDVATGLTVAYTGTLTGSQWLLIDCGSMRAARVTSDTWDLAAGTDVTGSVDSTGPRSSSSWLRLTSAMAAADPFSRTVMVTGAGSGTDGTTRLEIRARRAYR